MSNILLPIETQGRELDMRLVLGAKLVAQGHKVYMGDRRVVHSVMKRMKGGVYIGKQIIQAAQAGREKYYKHLRDNQIEMVFLDEEGAIYYGQPEEWGEVLNGRRYDLTRSLPTELVCNWGEFQQQYYKSLEVTDEPQMFVTGHPRFDLYKPKWKFFYQEEVTKLHERFGDYVLINTNLTYANSARGYPDPFSTRFGYLDQNGQPSVSFVEKWSVAMKNLAEFVELIHKLAKAQPNTNFIVRPHPSENIAFYEHAFNGCKNIHALQEGAVAPWIIGAKALIHDGCTTAIEAALTGTKIINYKPFGVHKHELLVPNELGVVCSSVDEVLTTLDVKDSPIFPEGKTLWAPRVLANFDIDSYEALMGVIDRALALNKAKGVKLVQPSFWKMSLTTSSRSIEGKLNAISLFSGQERRADKKYQRQKFPGLNTQEVRQKLKVLDEHLGSNTSSQFYSDLLLVLS